ncbi:MAG TPA: methyltransferase domain-containing protein [Lentimicrobium sp.]|nr:methyltransferase domain-containing protein [Lentimicrobium sp.]
MVSFKSRSYKSELMDSTDIPKKLLHKNLAELDILNRYLGGHKISLEGIKRLMTDKQKEYHIVDLGCGSGDVLRFIARWARSKQYQVKLTGVDFNAEAIKYLSAQSSEYPEITGITANYEDYLAAINDIDILHCGLFCHHLDDKKLLQLFKYLKSSQSRGMVINDLQRNPVAYFLVWVLTRLLNGSVLSKHDGLVSVLRGFKRKELEILVQHAGMLNVSIQWKWAFRYLVVVKN